MPVRQTVVGARNHQQPRLIARLERFLSDQVRRHGEFERQMSFYLKFFSQSSKPLRFCSSVAAGPVSVMK